MNALTRIRRQLSAIQVGSALTIDNATISRIASLRETCERVVVIWESDVYDGKKLNIDKLLDKISNEKRVEGAYR